jgi:hypothetical protein
MRIEFINMLMTLLRRFERTIKEHFLCALLGRFCFRFTVECVFNVAGHYALPLKFIGTFKTKQRATLKVNLLSHQPLKLLTLDSEKQNKSSRQTAEHEHYDFYLFSPHKTALIDVDDDFACMMKTFKLFKFISFGQIF